MDTKLFDEYALLKKEMEMLEIKADDIKSKLLKQMSDNGQSNYENVFGKFTLSSKKTYKFSESVKELEDKVKIAKDIELEKGIAKVKTETKYITFNPKK